MRVKCTSNRLSELLLTGFHREQLAAQFGRGAEPQWQAAPGKEYTVYAITIRRGCPFYFVAGSDFYQPYETIPSLCFEVLDARLSRYWRIKTRVVEHRRDRVLHTTLAFREWFEPMFLTNLVEGRPAEVERMRNIAAEMDQEFGRYPRDESDFVEGRSS